MDALTKFLRGAAARDFRLGEWDCGLWLADWYSCATGRPDPAVHLRGTEYRGRELIGHVRRIVRALNLQRTRDPQRGDIGIVRLKCFADIALGAIYTGQGWAVIGDSGLSCLKKPRLMAAWRLGYA